MNFVEHVSADELTALATGRSHDLFADDIRQRRDELHRVLGGAKVLVIGGAGSIGAATVQLLARFNPRLLHIVDHNENKLADLVRDFRSRPEPLDLGELRTFPIDFGSPVMHRLIADNEPYDLVLNFAAIKHVRSEKDVYSLLQMLDTNVVKAARLLAWLGERQSGFRYFCVSTDKAANPASLMGASKRAMEHTIFSGEVAPESKAHITSARFANVAFSDGSLLDSFIKRLQTRRPLAVPRDIRRYFISLSEAGQICLLAACCAPRDNILICRLAAETDLRDLKSIAEAVLRQHGFEPRIYLDESEAKGRVQADMAQGKYPLLVTEPDTSGEKPFEEFVGAGETAVEVGLKNLMAIPYSPRAKGAVADFLLKVERAIADPRQKISKEELSSWISALVPELQHHATGKNLDERM